jgi:hypothetical protein
MFFYVVVCRAATREAGLKGLIRAFTQEVMSNYVENKYVYFLSLYMSSLLLLFLSLIKLNLIVSVVHQGVGG